MFQYTALHITTNIFRLPPSAYRPFLFQDSHCIFKMNNRTGVISGSGIAYSTRGVHICFLVVVRAG